jgi:hypothetical protein
VRDTLSSLRPSAQRLLTALLVVVYVLAIATEVLPSVASASQVTSRSIQMSTSVPSAAAQYTISFTPQANAQELIIDFCSNDPLVNDTCSFSAATVPTITGGSLASSLGTPTSVGSGTPVHTIKVVGLTMTASTAYTITISAGITNPTSVTTNGFYARILTYATGNASGYAPANTTGGTPTLGTYVDYGGAALSTATTVNITSKVFETLSFCMYLSNSSCGGAAPSFTLGSNLTGALSVSAAYAAIGSSTSSDGAAFSLASNAASGVVITMYGTTLCRLSGIANCVTGTNPSNVINAIGSTPAALSLGTSQFGMCVDVSGITGATVATTYKDTANNCHGQTVSSDNVYTGTSVFGFNDSTTSGGTNNASGSTVMSTAASVPASVGYLSFLGDIAATTVAGIYTTNLSLIATGTF